MCCCCLHVCVSPNRNIFFPNSGRAFGSPSAAHPPLHPLSSPLYSSPLLWPVRRLKGSVSLPRREREREGRERERERPPCMSISAAVSLSPDCTLSPAIPRFLKHFKAFMSRFLSRRDVNVAIFLFYSTHGTYWNKTWIQSYFTCPLLMVCQSQLLTTNTYSDIKPKTGSTSTKQSTIICRLSHFSFFIHLVKNYTV